jgi:iron complex outermembrane receptor protein
MHIFRFSTLAAVIAGTLTSAQVTAAEPANEVKITTLSEVVVTEKPVSPLPDFQGRNLDIDSGIKSTATDAATLLSKEPGVAILRNGPRTGIVQMRGLANERVNILVDGMSLGTVNPNNFTPPLSNVMPLELDTVKVIAGITPVSNGGDSIAGTVLAVTKGPRFGTRETFEPQLEGQLGATSNGDGINTFVKVGAANLDTSINFFGGRQSGGDSESANGRILDSGYHVLSSRLSLGRRVDSGVMTLDIGNQRTDNTGNPAMAMDIIRSDADTVRLRYDGRVSFGRLEVDVYHHKTDETADNFSLRPVVSANRYYALGDRTDDGVKLKTTLTKGTDTLRFGGEYLQGSWDMAQYFTAGPFAGKSMDLFRDQSRNRLGIFGEWERQLSPRWNMLIGARSDAIWSSAGAVTNWVGTRTADAAAFNGANRDRTDHLWDFTALATYEADQASNYQFGLARKTRAPSLLERYLWSNFNGNGGIADPTNSYFGNLDLKPEVSHQVSFGPNWSGANWLINPVIYYSRVTDYIQGMPAKSPGGANVLKYSNVDAELTGIEGRWKYLVDQQWKFDGSLGYTLGKNLTSNQYLLQVSPLKAAFNADYAASNSLTIRAEWQLAARQDKVAVFKNELPTSGYGILNLRGSYRLAKNVAANFGVENVGDKYYAEHTAGLNQVANSSVAVNDRIPGLGRSAYAAIEIALP